jgi:hypothetical protein
VAESKQDRSKAAKLNGRARKGGKLSPEAKRWLDAYNARRTISRAKKLPSASRHTPVAHRPVDKSPASSSSWPKVVRGEQLALVGDVPTSRDVHETVPLDGVLSPDEFTWSPVVPAAPEGAELPPEGAPQPPEAGTPIVTEAPPAASSGAPPGDPAAVAQFRALVLLLSHVGLNSALELSAEWPMPPALRAALHDENDHIKALGFIGDAAERVAVKYGFRSLPMADEVVVAAACGGSIFAWWTLQQKKSKTVKKPDKPESSTEKPADVRETDTPAAPKYHAEIAELLE